MTTPDYQTAAVKATETLIKNHITAAPVLPTPILKQIPGVLVVSFEELSGYVGMARRNVIDLFGTHNQDAVTSVQLSDAGPRYMVAYNQQLPMFMVQRALARELGHIILGHDGSRPEEVRLAEAEVFARHLICPRALIHSVAATGIRMTKEVLGNLTGCYERCLAGMRRSPEVRVPAELNRQVRDQFLPYVMNFFEFQRITALDDGSALADFGDYMKGYEE
jgi:hypothetical protein